MYLQTNNRITIVVGMRIFDLILHNSQGWSIQDLMIIAHLWNHLICAKVILLLW